MKNGNIPYQLIQEKTGDTLFRAAFVKYYPGSPFCALMEEYPAEKTKIWVCRKVDHQTTDFGYRLAKLVSSSYGSERIIGHYVKVFEAFSEKEAEDRLISNMIGMTVIKESIVKEESHG